MPISLSHLLGLVCPECDVRFEFPMWIIIDETERPDLWELCRVDCIHLVRCPSGHPGRVPGPLLLHDSTRKRLLYSPRPGAASDEALSELKRLLMRFTREVGDERYVRILLKTLDMLPREIVPLGMEAADKKTISAINDMHEALSSPISQTSPQRRTEICRRALTLFRKDQAPALWATFQNRLSNALLRDSEGDRASKLEEAIVAAEASIADGESNPLLWAMGKSNLATIYVNRIQGDRERNIEVAIECARAALSILTRRSFPQFWAAAQQNLGNALLCRKVGDTNRNKREAISALAAAVEVTAMESDPKAWGDIQQNLGVAWFELSDGDLPENIEEAISAYRQALRVRTPESSPLGWIHTQMDLGNAYQARVRGERTENCELAIEAYQVAAISAHEHGFPFQWARLQYDLCHAYQQRVRGSREETLKGALDAGLAAASVLTEDSYPADFGRVQQNLGNIYIEMSRYEDQAENIECAIAAYTAALSVWSPKGSPVDWLMAMNGLSTAYYDRPSKNRVQDREKSLQLIEEALAVDVSEIAPRTHARFLANLGTAYRDRARDGRSEYSKRAVEAFSEACHLLSELRLYGELRATAVRLAEMRFENSEWAQAQDELAAVVAVSEESYTSAITTEGKEAEAAGNSVVYQMLCEASLALCRPRQALLYAEEGRSRVLRDELRTVPVPIPPDTDRGAIQQETELQQRLRSLKIAIGEAESSERRRSLVGELDSVHRDLNTTWDKLSKSAGGLEYISLRRERPLGWEEIIDWITAREKRSALIEYFTLRQRLVAFILRPGDSDPLVIDLPITPAELIDLALAGVAHFASPPESAQANTAARDLGSVLITPLMTHLTGMQAIFIAPHGILHGVPFLALEHDGRPLIEYATVTFVPSIAVAIRMQTADTGSIADNLNQLFVAGNPTSDLNFAGVEASAIARMFHVPALLEEKANKQNILDALGSSPCVHIAAHAYHDSNDPFSSGIVTHGGDVLTARDLMACSLRLRLMVLSACETGIQRLELSENHAGLTRALLCAGVSSLVVSLWPVDDLSTMLLMHRFYSHLYEGQSVDAALQSAQLWLRGVNAEELVAWFTVERNRPAEKSVMDYGAAAEAERLFSADPPDAQIFHDPFFWSGFILVGVE
jgi:CHAT domain-containing protein/tetratricopeptide (TPR) repeat protein